MKFLVTFCDVTHISLIRCIIVSQVDKILLQRKINKIHKLAAESYRYICFKTPHIFLERTAFRVLTGNGKQIRGI